MEFIFPVRVYYEDTDVAGVVYYANYLKFMERGRTEWLRHLGMEQDILIEQDIAFAVRRANIEYHQPARFNDSLQVISKIAVTKRASIEFYQQIVNLNGSSNDSTKSVKVLCEGHIKVACVTMSTMRPRKIPQQLLEVMRRDP